MSQEEFQKAAIALSDQYRACVVLVMDKDGKCQSYVNGGIAEVAHLSNGLVTQHLLCGLDSRNTVPRTSPDWVKQELEGIDNASPQSAP